MPIVFDPKDWHNFLAGGTNISADALKDLETRVAAFAKAYADDVSGITGSPTVGAIPVGNGSNFAALPADAPGHMMVVRSDGTLGYVDNVIYAAAWGVVADNSTECTAALQNALNAAPVTVTGFAGNDVAARKVKLPAGPIRIDGSPVIPTNCHLEGHGIAATYLRRNTGGTSSLAVLRIASGAVEVMISDLGIICADGAVDCIDLAGLNGSPSITADGNAIVRDVVCVGGHRAVVAADGTQVHLSRVMGYRQGLHAFDLAATDCFVEGCVAAQYGQVNASGDVATALGFNIHGENSRVSGCKAFGGLGSIENTCGGFGVSGRSEVVGCEAQDCGGSGFGDQGGQPCTFTGCLADSCQYVGFYVNTAVVSGCVALNRGGLYTMQAALRVSGPAHVRGLITNQVRRYIVGAAQPSGALIDIDNRFGPQTVAYAGTITPDPWLGGTVYVGSITGALAIANPQSNPTNGVDGTSAWYQAGQELTFVLPQDGAGHAVTFGTAYKLAGGTAIPTTASSVTTVTFAFDGTNWRETKRATT